MGWEREGGREGGGRGGEAGRECVTVDISTSTQRIQC